MINDLRYYRDEDVLVINGVRYSGLMFHGLATLPEGVVIKIVKREDGVLTIKEFLTEIDYNG